MIIKRMFRAAWVMVVTMAVGCSSMHSDHDHLAAIALEDQHGAMTSQGGDSVSPTTGTQLRDPRAEDMILKLAQQAKNRRIFSFKFVDEFDDVQTDGRKIQIAHLRQGIISRPDRFKIETTGDVANRTLLNDGKTVTVWDRAENIYAQMAAPGTIDQTLDSLMERYNVTVPAADLFYDDPGKSLLEERLSSEYVGLSTVDGVSCHHLAFTGAGFDWQVWIEEGDLPALRKLVIDYKTMPGRPQYVLRVLSVKTLDAVEAAEFQFNPPRGAELVEMQPAARADNR